MLLLNRTHHVPANRQLIGSPCRSVLSAGPGSATSYPPPTHGRRRRGTPTAQSRVRASVLETHAWAVGACAPQTAPVRAPPYGLHLPVVS